MSPEDERVANLSDEIAMCLLMGLPVFAACEYELMALVDADERTVLELAATCRISRSSWKSARNIPARMRGTCETRWGWWTLLRSVMKTTR